jgi:glycosyltransferase involved in cell wall biosynthesis
MTTYTGLTTCDDWRCHCGVRRADHHHDFEREEFRFVAMLRIRNEARWIEEVIRSTFQLCNRVFVMDDHSTDGTMDILRSIQGGYDRLVILPSPFTGINESRDKNWLYDQVIANCKPEWVLCIDGDEVLEGPAGEAIRRTIDLYTNVNSWALKIEFLWNDEHTVRTDRIYGDFWRPSLFRAFHERPGVPDSRKLLEEFRFQSTPFGRHVGTDKPNLHCSSVPQRLIHGFKRIPARLKHYGYMERTWRVAKLDYYTSIDWENQAEDCYRHMCQGDAPAISELPKIRDMVHRGILDYSQVNKLTEVSAEAHLVHAGPLELSEWEEGKPWHMSNWALAQNGWSEQPVTRWTR